MTRGQEGGEVLRDEIFPRRTKGAVVVAFFGLMLMLAASGCSGSDGIGDSAGLDPLGSQSPPADGRDAVEIASKDISMGILRLMQDEPPTPLRLSLAEYGGVLTTEAQVDSEAEEQAGPQLYVSRELDLLPDETDSVGGNSLTIMASVPAGDGTVRFIEQKYSFTQHSLLAVGDLSVDRVVRAFQGEESQELSVSSVMVQRGQSYADTGGREYLGFDVRSGVWLYAPPGSTESQDVDEAKIDQIVDECRAVLEAVKEATDQLLSRLATQSFVGEWYVHGSTLTISSNTTGHEISNAGPCGTIEDFTPASTPCEERDDFSFSSSGDGTSLEATVTLAQVLESGTNVEHPEMTTSYRVGDKFTLTFAAVNLLQRTPSLGNPYLCNDETPTEIQDLCGA